MDCWVPFDFLFIPAIVIGSWLIFRWVRKRARLVVMMDKLPHSKGHFLFGNMGEFMVSRLDLFEARRKFALRFKDEVLFSYWIGPSKPIVELSKAEAIEVSLISYRLIEKTKSNRYFEPWLGSGLNSRCGLEWATRRKTLTPSFNLNILDGFVDVLNEKAIILTSKIDCYAVENKSFDLCPMASLCALDIICETAMQKCINCQEDGTSEYVHALNDTKKIIMERCMKPWLHYDWLFALMPMGKKFNNNLKILHGFTDKVIAERLQRCEQGKKTSVSMKEQVEKEDDFGIKKRLGFLDTLFGCYENGQKLSAKEIRSEVDTFMFAGHDTTLTATLWTIFLLGHHRSIQDKVHNELDAIFGASTSSLTSSDLKKMKYLECVIKESLRLYPPVPLFGRCLNEDIHIAGHELPAGAAIVFNLYMLHRDPRYFPDPEAFDPDRFLPENSCKIPLYAFMPFSVGSRNCIGQKFAMMELKIVLAHLLQRFHITSMESRQDMKLISDVVGLRPANGLWIRVEKRKSEQ